MSTHPDSNPPRETLFETRWLAVHRIGHWDFVERPNADCCVAILPVTPAGEIILVEQFRIPVQQRAIEIPAGLVGDEDDHRGEALAETAARELLEETGFRAGRVEHLLASPTSAGMTSETTHFFLATALVREHPGGGIGSEDIKTHIVPLAGLRGWLAGRENDGMAIDCKIHAALWAAEPRLRTLGLGE
jgi:ADP-ribose pyrophosphatase